MASSATMKTVSILYEISSVLLPLTIIYVSPPGTSLFSWHPVLMSMAIGLLMAQAVVIFNPGFNIFTSGTRSAVVTWHWCLQAMAVAGLYVGFTAVYVNKNLNSNAHFTSWHGILGLATVIGATGASFGGIATKYGVKFPPLIRPAHIKWVHSIAGTAVFTIGCFALLLGLSSNWAMNQMNRLERCGLGSVAIFMLLVVWYLAKRNYLLKIFQSK